MVCLKQRRFINKKREQKKKSGKRATDKIICWFQESMDYFGSTLVYTYRHSFIYNNNNIIIIITIMTVYFDVAWHVEWEPTKDYFFLKTNHYLISAGCTHDSCGLFCGYVTAYYHVSPSMQRACVLYRKSKDFIWVLRGCWCCRCFYYQGNTRAAAGYPSQGMQSIATPAVFFFFLVFFFGFCFLVCLS